MNRFSMFSTFQKQLFSRRLTVSAIYRAPESRFSQDKAPPLSLLQRVVSTAGTRAGDDPETNVPPKLPPLIGADLPVSRREMFAMEDSANAIKDSIATSHIRIEVHAKQMEKETQGGGQKPTELSSKRAISEGTAETPMLVLAEKERRQDTAPTSTIEEAFSTGAAAENTATTSEKKEVLTKEDEDRLKLMAQGLGIQVADGKKQ